MRTFSSLIKALEKWPNLLKNLDFNTSKTNASHSKIVLHSNLISRYSILFMTLEFLAVSNHLKNVHIVQQVIHDINQTMAKI